MSHKYSFTFLFIIALAFISACLMAVVLAHSNMLLRVIIIILLTGWISISWITLEQARFINWTSTQKINAEWKWQVTKAQTIERHFTPLVQTLDDHNDVAMASRQLIMGENLKPVFLNALVVFLGAAGKQSENARKEELKLVLREDSERTPAQVYQGAIDEMMSSQIPVYRVVSLLSTGEYIARSIEKQNQYLSWLRNQISQLNGNKNYVFFDNPRAPKWGGVGASIVTSVGYLQFTSPQGDALFVKHERIARNLIREVMQELSWADEKNRLAYTSMRDSEHSAHIKAKAFGKHVPVLKMQEHFDNLYKITYRDDPIASS